LTHRFTVAGEDAGVRQASVSTDIIDRSVWWLQVRRKNSCAFSCCLSCRGESLKIFYRTS